MNIIKVAAVVVLYRPDWVLLADVIKSISKQCSKIIVVDNSEADNTALFNENLGQFKNAEYYPLEKNSGIAYAQNFGILKAKEMGYDAVILFDQDSIPDPKMAEELINGYKILEHDGIKVGSVGPRAYSRATNEVYKAKFATGKSIYPQITDIAQLTSSGSLVKVATFDAIGLFEEDLFIDLVDFEWCWRACNKYGYKHFIIESTRLSHMFGVKEKRILSFRLTIPTSFRIYYQFRNYFILVKRRYVPIYWKISNAFKLLIKLFLFPLICKGGSQYLKNSFKGIKHGIVYDNRKIRTQK